MMNMNNKGQIILILLLITTVAMGIALSITSRSLSDISSATKVEQSSRAFSGAEAGIERALRTTTIGTGGTSTTDITLPENNTGVRVSVRPALPDANGQALEYPPVTKEEVAQVWLVDPDTLAFNLYPSTSNKNLYIYWGNPSQTTDLPALELNFVYRSTDGSYKSKKFFYDLTDSRRSTNGFDNCPTLNPAAIVTTLSPQGTVSPDRSFKCKVQITITGADTPPTFPNISQIILVRARVLYSSSAQPFAVQPQPELALPPQASIYDSTGTSGTTERKVRLFQEKKVVPYYFDYAIFSMEEITK